MQNYEKFVKKMFLISKNVVFLQIIKLSRFEKINRTYHLVFGNYCDDYDSIRVMLGQAE